MWYSSETAPELGNRFRLRLRLRCVRASERSCVREMIPLWLGSGGEICGYPSLPPSVCPSVRPGAGPDEKLELFEFRPMNRDRVELLNVPVWWSRCVVFVSCVFCVCALLDRCLGQPVAMVPPALDPRWQWSRPLVYCECFVSPL